MYHTKLAGCAVLALITVIASYGVAQAAKAKYDTTTRLLFPFVTNQAGFDTGLSIANTSANPFGTPTQSGTCTLTFYGAAAPSPVTTPVIGAGTVFTSLASVLAPGFQGYMIANCRFGFGEGTGFVSDLAAKDAFSSYIAEVLPLATPLQSNEVSTTP
ncbi:MAG: hypothetical protein ACLQAT_17875 [Candidatus Binataceae bacterium]